MQLRLVAQGGDERDGLGLSLLEGLGQVRTCGCGCWTDAT
jgi:hypothetical protein